MGHVRGETISSRRFAPLEMTPLGLMAYAVLTEIPTRLRWKYLRLRSRFVPELAEVGTSEVALAIQRATKAIAGACARYVPGIYEGRVDYFMNGQRARLPQAKWCELVTGGVARHVFPGDPNSTFHPKSVSQMFAKLKAVLRRVQAGQQVDAAKRLTRYTYLPG